MNELLDAALYYASKGWPVIPLHGWNLQGCTCRRPNCPSPAKHPRTRNGLKDATTDQDLIRAWWTQAPDSNVGLLTGIEFDVLDVDGDAGFTSLEELQAEHCIPETIEIETGGGGRHLLFKPLGAGNRAAMRPGLDWRGQGGYIVAPPSIHASGKRYSRLEGSSSNLAEVPDCLRELVQPTRRQPQPAAAPSEWTQTPVGPAYAQKALESELELLRQAEEGTRNHSLNKAAFSLFQLVKAGVLDPGDTWVALADVAREIGLEEVEIGRTLQSAYESAEAREVANPTIATIFPDSGVVIVKPDDRADRRLKLTPVSEIPPVKTDWLWDGRVPMGALTLVGGREGIGKSTLCYDIASDITRGTVRGFHNGQPRSVLIVATEDDWGRTIRPRLTAAKADLDRVFQVTVERARPDAGPLELTLPHDTAALTELVKANDVDMILLDPLLSRVDVRLDSHKDADVRTALEPVTKLASDTGCAVLGLIHVNKSGSKDPLTSLMGSRAFVAVARAVLFVMVDPEEEALRLLLQAKNNLGISDIPALKFSIDNTPAGFDANTGEEIFSGKLNWHGESALSVHVAMELADQSTDERTARKEAEQWLFDYLKEHNGIETYTDIQREARKADISKATLDRAKNAIGVRSKRMAAPGGPSVWFLPGHEPGGVVSDSPAPTPEMSEITTASQDPSDALISTTTTYLIDNSPLERDELVDDEALI